MYSRTTVVRRCVDNFWGGVQTKQCKKKNVYANHINSKTSCYDSCSISVYLYITTLQMHVCVLV